MTTTMTFEAIYKKYNRIVFTFIKNRIKDEMVAEELAADTMIKVHKSLHLYKEELSKLNTWIINIAKNCMIDHLRKRTLSVVSLESVYSEWNFTDDENLIDRISPLKETALNPEDQMISDEVSSTLYTKFDQLNESEKAVATLHFFEGLSYDEVAEQLRMPLGTVKAKLHNARVTMMEAFPSEMRK